MTQDVPRSEEVASAEAVQAALDRMAFDITARLAGISVKRMSTIVWALAGGLAAVATILAAPLAGATVASTGDLGPGMLLRTFAAAVIAGMASLPLALVAAVVVGIVESVLFFNNSSDPGLVNFVLLLVVLVAVLVVSMRQRGLGSIGGEEQGGDAGENVRDAAVRHGRAPG